MEIRHVWAAKCSFGLALFLTSRYLGVASCIVSLFPTSPTTSNLVVCTRVLTIIVCEATLAVRTWAIWGRNRWILFILVGFAIGAIIPAAITVSRDITTKEIKTDTASEVVDPFCVITEGDVGNMWAVPYLMTIMYATVTTSLSLIRIVWWRRRIPRGQRGHVLHTLYTDGLLYFLLMLVIGAVNTGLVIKTTAPELRSSVTQLQTSLHSILASRIILHLANSGHPVKEVHTSGSTLAPGGAQFTSIFTSDSHELMNVTDAHR
ncbi:hypothetical protein ONZ45_g5245 [Pleurotus djamor]|nr:hypothetical protein ONZ45_g5245 [Pleurotus djamor]